MSNDVHTRARELALSERVEGLAESDRQWLHHHAAECLPCAQFAESLEQAVSSMRLPAVMAGTSLVRATQGKMRQRALEMQAHAAMMRPLWVAVALVCAWAAFTTPIMWAAFAWIGALFHLTNAEWRTGFALSWLAPSIAASFILLGCESNRARWRVLLVQNAGRL